MAKRVTLILVWTVAFPLIYFILSTIMFGVIGTLKIFPKIPPHMTEATMTPAVWYVAIFGMVWASLFWLSPVVGLILGICGVLPGTRRQKLKESQHDA